MQDEAAGDGGAQGEHGTSQGRIEAARGGSAESPLQPTDLGKLVVPVGCRLYWSLLDLSDYYHVLLLPENLRSLFGLPPVIVDGVLQYPRWVTLPMGFSWAVYLA